MGYPSRYSKGYFHHIQIILDAKFHIKLTILVFWTKFALKGYFRYIRKGIQKEYFQHIRLSLDAKFHLKETVLIFWTKFAQKWYIRPITEKVNITIEFSIFKLV